MADRIPLSKLCEAIVDCEPKTAPTQSWGIPSIRTTNIKNGRIDFENANRLSEETYKIWTARLEPKPGDLILAREAPVGEVGIIPSNQRACLGQRTVLIRTNEQKINSRYLLYLLLTPEMRHEMSCRAEGSTVPHLNMSDIRGLEIPEPPPLPEQKTIAHILGTLDDKIELNQQMNRTLEAIARAIFKSWFVNFDPVRAKMEGRQPVGMDAATAHLFPDSFEDSALGKIPKGWGVGTLADIAKNPRCGIKPESITSDTPYIGLEHMPRRSIALSDWGNAADIASNKFKFYQGDILFGKLRSYFHKVGVAAIDGICSTDILVVSPKSPEWFSLVLSYVSSTEFIDYTDATSTGTRMPRTNWQGLTGKICQSTKL
ncbi:MAG: restriction endonuclease subunit S [Coleofasciculus sp. G1-WW12-02]|uniref:restriction endonuclease subunit S n=1 Tax=Coleofasciculus sp. G1-WW12-02 TaxID=3068483 RepID=UPI0032FDD2E6